MSLGSVAATRGGCFVTLSPIGWRPVTPAPVNLERFAAYAVLGGVFCLGYPKHRLPALLFLFALAGVT